MPQRHHSGQAPLLAPLGLALVLLLGGCALNRSQLQPTPTPTTQDITRMYTAVLDAFAPDLARYAHPDLLSRPVVYIRPTSSNTNTSLPLEVVQVIRQRTAALGLTQVAQEEAGGLAVEVTSIGNDPNARSVYQRDGPTIGISVRVSQRLMTGKGAAYLLTQTGAGWQAEQYMVVSP